MDNTTVIMNALLEIQERGGQGNFVIFMSDEEKNYFIQFAAKRGDKTLYGEAVSNVYLEPKYALDANQIERLKVIGWQYESEGSNLYKYWEANNDDERLNIAQAVIQTFIEVYGMSPLQQITVNVVLE